jgi:hypothetical protein
VSNLGLLVRLRFHCDVSVSHNSISTSRKEFGYPCLHHSSSPLTLADPIFDSDIDPNGSLLRRLVNVDVLVVMKMDMDVTENNGVLWACHSNGPICASSDSCGRRRIHNFG